MPRGNSVVVALLRLSDADHSEAKGETAILIRPESFVSVALLQHLSSNELLVAVTYAIYLHRRIIVANSRTHRARAF